MAKWDYQVLEIAPSETGAAFQHSLQNTLKTNGSQGWELIEVLPSPGNEPAVLMISKRPIESK